MRRRYLTRRIRLLTLVVGLLAAIIIGRLYQLQVLEHEQYRALAERQYVHTETDLYDRGSIYFSTRDETLLSAASVRSGFVLAANPQLITNPAEFCAEVAPFVTVPPDRCESRVSDTERVYVELADRVTDERAAEIRAADISGAQLYRTQWRYYPGGAVAARAIGFVGYGAAGNELRGRYGLERYYDDVLYQTRDVQSVNFFAELFSNVGDVLAGGSDTPSGDVVTSLEPSVSRMLDTVLTETNSTYDSKLTGAIVIDPETGEIVAMNAVPAFNLNDRADASIEQFQNPLVENVYEFGSTIKALTMAAGLDSGAVTPRSTYYDAGSIELDTETIYNFDGRGRGTVPMQEVLNQSLNTGVAHIVKEMGKEEFREYFLDLKLGSEAGIDLPNEVHGLVENLNSPRDVEYATASFGQGIALTPIAATRALATLANDGRLVTPHLATEIRYENGQVKPIRYPEGDQVFSVETSEEISRMLSIVVDDALRGGTVALPNHTIAAKTGTAQIPDPEQGGYYEDRFLHSFFGYFPAYDPEFLVFMYTVEPQGVRYASETLTQPFMDITRFLINYYSIPPDR